MRSALKRSSSECACDLCSLSADKHVRARSEEKRRGEPVSNDCLDGSDHFSQHNVTLKLVFKT